MGAAKSNGDGDEAAPVENRIDDYRSLVENAVEGIYRTTPDGHYLNANQALARLYGYDSPSALIAGVTDIARYLYVDPNARERFKAALATDSVVRDFEAQIYRKDGSVIWITENARAVRDAAGGLICYEGTVEDITARKQSEEGLRLAAIVFENVDEAIMVTDRQGVVLTVNPAFERVTGWLTEDVVGHPSRLLATELCDPALLEEQAAALAVEGTWAGELWAKRADGATFPASISVTQVRAAGGSGGQTLVTVFRDESQRKAAEQQIRFQARYDALTRLVNRPTVTAYLTEALKTAETRHNRLAALFLDVNRFKDVNDSFGHSVGDDLLREVARRLRSCMRATDIVGRLGGDEFVVILPSVPTAKAVEACLDKIQYAFSEPFPVAGREIFVSTSIGIAVSPDDARDADTLMSYADIAMYHAKATSQAAAYYNEEMKRAFAERVNIETDLRQAMAERRFRLCYQPKVDAATGLIVGAEALLRWRHPTRGEISPAQFIPVAERTGLIGAIGDWVLREACRQIKLWQESGLMVPRISVNLSPVQFRDPELCKKIGEVLAAAAVDPASIEVEVTETAMAAEINRALAVLSEIRDMGVHISIDDFGTGYSSLSYLKMLPVNALKIDRAFVKDLPNDAKDGAIVASVMTLATQFGFEVFAEGVETAEQRDILTAKGCTLMQGFLYSKAVEVEDFGHLLRDGVPAPEDEGEPSIGAGI